MQTLAITQPKGSEVEENAPASILVVADACAKDDKATRFTHCKEANV